MDKIVATILLVSIAVASASLVFSTQLDLARGVLSSLAGSRSVSLECVELSSVVEGVSGFYGSLACYIVVSGISASDASIELVRVVRGDGSVLVFTPSNMSTLIPDSLRFFRAEAGVSRAGFILPYSSELLKPSVVSIRISIGGETYVATWS